MALSATLALNVSELLRRGFVLVLSSHSGLALWDHYKTELPLIAIFEKSGYFSHTDHAQCRLSHSLLF